MSGSRTERRPLRAWGLGFGVVISTHPEAAGNIRGKPCAKRLGDPLTKGVGDVCSGPISELGQDGSSHALLTVPADEVAVAEVEPQTREELAGDRRVDARAYPWLLF